MLGLLGVCGLAELAKGAPTFSNSQSLKDAGGFLGAAVGRPLHAGIGSVGAAVLLVAVVFVAVLVATGVSLATVGRTLHSAAAWTGRTGAALWRGKPFVVTSDLGEEAPVETASSRRVPFDAEADLAADEDLVDDDIDPEPEPEPVVEAARAEALAPPVVASPGSPVSGHCRR